MTSEAYKAFIRDHEAYPNPWSTHAEALKLRQPVEPRTGSSRRSFLDDALRDRSKSDRLRARRHLHNSATHHDRERSEPDKQAYVEEEDPETGALHRWEPKSGKSSVHGRAEGIGKRLAPRPKQENHISSPESVTTNNEAKKHHEEARVSRGIDRCTVDGEGHQDSLEDLGLKKNYIDGMLDGVDKYKHEGMRGWMLADIKRQLRLQNDLQEMAVHEATITSSQPQDLRSLMARIRGTSRRATSTPESQKPGASSSTRTQPLPTSSTSHVSRHQGEDSHKNFDPRQSHAHDTTRGSYSEEEKRNRKEIKENHMRLCKSRKEKAARDATTLGSVQTSGPQPIIANGMSSSRSAAGHPKDHKPSASSRTRPQVSPIKSTPDALSVRSAGLDHTTREHETLVRQRPVVHHPRRPSYTHEAKITRSDSRSSSHRGTRSRNGR